MNDIERFAEGKIIIDYRFSQDDLKLMVKILEASFPNDGYGYEGLHELIGNKHTYFGAWKSREYEDEFNEDLIDDWTFCPHDSGEAEEFIKGRIIITPSQFSFEDREIDPVQLNEFLKKYGPNQNVHQNMKI